jgi:hypothetical protein
MGKYIKLQTAFFQTEIHSSDILQDIDYFQPAEMYYQGGIFILFSIFHE